MSPSFADALAFRAGLRKKEFVFDGSPSSEARLPAAARHTARVGGIDIHWAELGPADATAPPIVLVHGFTRSHRVWLPAARLLARTHRVFALDLPGFGESGRPDAPYTLEWHAERVDEWMGHLGLAGADVAGHSYGGAVLQWLLIVNRSRIRRLGLVSAGGLGSEVTFALRIASSVPSIVSRVADPAVAAVGAMIGRFPSRSLQLARTWVADNNMPGTGRALARSVRNVVNVRGQSRSFYDHASLIAELPPMRVFWGEDDRTIPALHGTRLTERLENCQFVQFPNCGHSPPRERPRELARALHEFFAADHVPPAKWRSTSLS